MSAFGVCFCLLSHLKIRKKKEGGGGGYWVGCLRFGFEIASNT